MSKLLDKYLTMYTLPYFPFPINLSFLKSPIFIPQFKCDFGDWHNVESVYLSYFWSLIKIYLKVEIYFFFVK